LTTTLRIPYLPYGRQDKGTSNFTTFALRSFAKILNNLVFNEVIIMDAHSKVAELLINNSRVEYPTKQLISALNVTGAQLLCYPDEGALEKYSEIYEEPFISGKKQRDQLTGQITSYELIGDCAGKNIMIVDDICDGGATFLLLTKELYKQGATEVNLFVSHGLFSKGAKILFDSGIKRIFTKEGEECLEYRLLT
jgi:ribose-phosphate pyrophosphokinase